MDGKEHQAGHRGKRSGERGETIMRRKKGRKRKAGEMETMVDRD